MPNEDTVDTALTLYVNGDNGLHIGDGVNQPTQLASNTFLTLTAVCRDYE